MADDLTDAIVDAAQEPLEATVDGQTAKSRPIDELIQADQYAKAQAAVEGTNDQGGVRSAWACLRPARARTQGTI